MFKYGQFYEGNINLSNLNHSNVVRVDLIV